MPASSESSRVVTALMDLQGLVQNLAQSRRSGVVTVSAAEEERQLHFANGQIVALSGQRPDLFTRALCWMGMVTRDRINAVIQTLGEVAGPEDLLAKLLADRILSREAILDAIDCMIEEEFTGLLGWSQPHLGFAQHQVLSDPFAEAQRSLGVSVNAGAVLLEGLRRQDELATVAALVPDPWDTLVRIPDAPPPAEAVGGDAELLLADWRDGAVCGALLEHPRLPPFRATMAVARLRRSGLVRLSTPQEQLVQADTAKAAGALRKAFGLYRRVLARGQDLPRVHLVIAELAERFDDRAVAIQALLAASGQLPDPEASARALTDALRLGADPEQPLTQLVAIRLQLDQVEQAVTCLLELAKLYERRRAFEPAAQAVREAQELGADPATVALLLARLATAQGDQEQAVLQLEVAARAFHESERIEEAMAAWRELLRLVPGRCDYARECAELMLWSGDRDGAVAALRNALRAPAGGVEEDVLLPMYELLAKLDPADVPTHDWLAKAYERRRDRDGATGQLRLAAAAQEKVGDHRHLAETLERILELDGQQSDILDWLARTRVELGQDAAAAQAWSKASDFVLARGARKEARALLERAVARLPASASLRLRLAQVANRDGDREAAQRQFRAAGDLASGGGELVVARDAFTQLSRLRPDDVLARVRLAEVAIALKDTDLDRILAELVRVAIRTGNLGLALEHAKHRVDLAGKSLAWEARSELVDLHRRTGDAVGELAIGRDLVARLLAAGDNRHAVEVLGRLVASHPKDPDLALQHAEASNALGAFRDAVRLFRQAVVLLQVDNRGDEARAVLGSLIQIDEDAEGVAAARAWMDAGQVVDWEKIRLELMQRRRQERGGTEGATRRPGTDRRPGSGKALRPTTDRAGLSSGRRAAVAQDEIGTDPDLRPGPART